MSDTYIEKRLDYDQITKAFDSLLPIDDSVVNQQQKEMPVFDIILNHDEATDEMLEGITLEAIEMAWDTMNYCASMEDSEITIEAYRDSIYQHVYAREWIEGCHRLSATKPRVAFF